MSPSRSPSFARRRWSSSTSVGLRTPPAYPSCHGTERGRATIRVLLHFVKRALPEWYAHVREAQMSVTDELLQNAERYADEFDRGGLPLPPAKRVAVLACMDARPDPARAPPPPAGPPASIPTASSGSPRATRM